MITNSFRFNPSRGRVIARRGRVVVAVTAITVVAGACGAGNNVADDQPPTTAAAPRPEANAVGATTAAAPTTVAIDPNAPTTSAPAAVTPSEAPGAPPALAIPEPIRGVWRESEAASVSLDDCRQTEGFEQNFDKVLTIDADRFSYFESGGRLIEVNEQDESRIDATFDTTYADTPTEARVTLDAQDDGAVLIVRSDDRPGPLRYVRCPGSPAEQANTAPLELDSFVPNAVSDAGLEAIGCWLRPGEASDLDPIFFVNGDDGLMVIDGKPVELPDRTSGEDAVIPTVEVGLTYSGDGFAATFAAVGPERPVSIESSDRDVTLAVAAPDGRRSTVKGVLGCGV
jgi:hypothetical protein